MRVRTKQKKRHINVIRIIVFILVVILTTVIIKSCKDAEPDIDIDKIVLELDAGNNLYITQIDSYFGPYIEDGTNEEVENVLMIQLTNRSDKTLQYAEIMLEAEEESYNFKVSTIQPGQTIKVLEADRKKYDANQEYNSASSQYVAYFKEELNLYEGVLKLQPLNGGFNISNVSDNDIVGEIVVYFKDWDGNHPFGGITYRGRLEGGLKAGELKQVMASKFTENNTTVMFITVVGQ